MTRMDASISLDEAVMTLEEAVESIRDAQADCESNHTVDLTEKWIANIQRMIVEMRDESDRLYPIPVEELEDFMSPEEIAEELERRKKWEGIE